MLTIVLIEPEIPGNIGAVARAMANFNFRDLAIVSPKCDSCSREAIQRAKRAKNILKKARILRSFKDLKPWDYLIGTTGNLGSSYNILRSPITPEQLGEKMHDLANSKVALILGREGNGLTNEEIAQCDFIVTIATSPKYSSLNISHALTILLYEIFKASKKKKIGQHIVPLPPHEKDQLLKKINAAIAELPFSSDYRRKTQRSAWKRLVGKSLLTRREGYTLMGFFEKLRKHL